MSLLLNQLLATSSLYYSWLLTTDSKIASYESSYNAPTDQKYKTTCPFFKVCKTLQKVSDHNFPEPTNPHGPNIQKKSDRVDGQDYYFCF